MYVCLNIRLCAVRSVRPDNLCDDVVHIWRIDELYTVDSDGGCRTAGAAQSYSGTRQRGCCVIDVFVHCP